jgi:SAM-dependent methyltransferase
MSFPPENETTAGGGREYPGGEGSQGWGRRIARRLPAALRRSVLLPIWNGAHHVGWEAGLYLDAIRYRQFERCTVCGRFGPILYRWWVIPPRLVEIWGLSPPLTAALARKESNECSGCGAKLRVRRLAQVFLELYSAGAPPCGSVREWVSRPVNQPMSVAEINRIDGMHRELARLPGLAYSEYLEGVAPGFVVNGVRNEDLTDLSYPSDSFDVVLTSETLEHVPDLPAALAEIHRVLRPGGRHIFTIPWLPGVPATFARSIIRPDGTVENRATRICHPGGDVGYPVFTEIGADFPQILERAGFEVEVRFGPPTEEDLAQVIVCRKLAATIDRRDGPP